MNKKIVYGVCDIMLYFFVFLILQVLAYGIFSFATKDGTTILTASSALSSVLTIALYVALKWSPFSATIHHTNPWMMLCWIILLSIGLILPSAYIEELMGVEMSEQMINIFETIMSQPLGIVAIAFLAPIAEEMVFRGAVLRRLLELFPRVQYYKRVGDKDYFRSNSYHWMAIAISALAFALAHGNLAQGLHAFAIGLLLGWLYYRTKSILPGIIYHWVNNGTAVLAELVAPGETDDKLIQLFGGNATLMYLLLAVSALLSVIALWSLIKMRRW